MLVLPEEKAVLLYNSGNYGTERMFGKIADIGRHDELIRNSSIYREIYSSQLKGGFNG